MSIPLRHPMESALAARMSLGAAREEIEVPPFGEVYEAQFDFVHRSVRRLGVREAAVEDVVQDVFVVVHRRLETFEGRSSIKTWIFAIVLRVVRDHRRTVRRKHLGEEAGDLELVADTARGPHESAAQNEAVRLLQSLLDQLDDDKREVFILAELEQMTAPEIAEATGANVNTVYARLRAARQEFERAVARHHARERRAPSQAPGAARR